MQLHRTQPHGSQRILLSEDHEKFENRIYVILNEDGRWVPMIGSELQDLSNWVEQEKQREGELEDAGTAKLAVWDFIRGVEEDRAMFYG